MTEDLDDDELQFEKLGAGADSWGNVERFIPKDVLSLYEVFSYKHAAAILANCAVPELNEILDALRRFRLPKDWISAAGGNESAIPKAFSQILRPRNWHETKIHGDLVVTLEVHKILDEKKAETAYETIKRKNFLSGHKIDYLKNGVAFDLEWNSKDQTFDRDLIAMRAFHEFGVVTAGIIVTRSADLNEVFDQLKVKNKYGASTTWMGKLLPRLDAGRNGSCPILVFGITRKLLIEN